MLRFDAAAFFWLASVLEVREDTERTKGDTVFSAEERKEERESFKKMAEICREMELRFTVKYIKDHILGDLKEPNFNHAQLASMIYQLRDRIADELSDKVFIHVEDLKYYAEKNLFGDAVTDKLPQLITDIEEAGKCLALS